MRSYVVGTAGHIDHGKSTLVRALTGTDPDRLAEEKLRGMTIDLGFAHLTTPAGREVGVVDVPGHERFIKTMLAGVGGIDAAVLVVAADEGPMPQTIEHLDILTLLGVERGVVALTKSDLVEPDWADYVAEELRERLAGSTLAAAEVVPVSAAAGSGLDELRSALDRSLSDLPARDQGGKPRLPVDRVFTMAGFGTVVTGTLIDGALTVGMEVEICPAGHRGRIRGLQTHGTVVERASAGQRVAVNLQGVTMEQVRRGDVVALPGAVPVTRMVDVRIELLANAPLDLETQARVDVFSGSTEVGARVALIERDVLRPGEHGWAQLHFDAPVAVLRGDRLVIRRPTPSATIGGGTVIDPQPRRHRRTETGVAERLKTLAAGTPRELVLSALGLQLKTRDEVAHALPALSTAVLSEAFELATEAGDLLAAGATHLVTRPAWDALGDRMAAMIEEFHRTNPLRRGMPREELRSRLKLTGGSGAFDASMSLAAQQGILVDEERTVRRPAFVIELPAVQRAAAARYLELVDASPYAPPGPAEAGLSKEALVGLVERGELVEVGDGIVYRPETLDAIKTLVLAHIERHGKITLADYRDAVGTSRKFAQATLEFLDGVRVTRRVGDDRVRGR
ncbi:MAG: Selenocysteine-specific translation elongation factor [uncultured Thermomicrobiales bacterium]|uniref:Selenocysteine-specific elongation factor n=1 Tax=uncultured Thermomicrobiales bacterium TaxID=1645740 RepID=A0A6J4VH92_9BACT|nr:MAG: Selenocysteine-specific translation elongation factor [uncultured Thermomicrobiales bacterium]